VSASPEQSEGARTGVQANPFTSTFLKKCRYGAKVDRLFNFPDLRREDPREEPEPRNRQSSVFGGAKPGRSSALAGPPTIESIPVTVMIKTS
jgi:hypothetical protein